MDKEIKPLKCNAEYYDTDMAYTSFRANEKGVGGLHFSKQDLILRKELNKATINKKYGKLVN
jgi:hypothetical protein